MCAAIAVDASPRLSNSAADGRTERGRRTRDAVVEAVLELLSAGEIRPTAKQIAEQAGISLRSVYVHFEDLDGLFRAAHERSLATIVESWHPIDTDLPFDDRVRAFSAQRCDLMESLRGVAHGAALHEPFSREIAAATRAMRQLERDEIAAVFGVELTRHDAATRERLLDAACLVCDSGAWRTLRTSQGLDAGTAREVLETGLRALFGGAAC